MLQECEPQGAREAEDKKWEGGPTNNESRRERRSGGTSAQPVEKILEIQEKPVNKEGEAERAKGNHGCARKQVRQEAEAD